MTSAILHVIDMTTFVDTIYYGPHTPGNGGPNSYAIKSGDICTEFQTYAYSSTVDPNLTISKTQLLSLLDGVIEHSSTFFMEPLDAIIMFCNNVKQKGGTPYLAAYYEKILKALE